jgi:hypothetical protein
MNITVSIGEFATLSLGLFLICVSLWSMRENEQETTQDRLVVVGLIAVGAPLVVAALMALAGLAMVV